MHPFIQRFGTEGKRTILRYTNRKLYDPKTRGYVSFEDLRGLVLRDEPFEVLDSRDGTDQTPQILCSLVFHLSRRGYQMPHLNLIGLIRSAFQDAPAL